jgi:hypothetical protein
MKRKPALAIAATAAMVGAAGIVTAAALTRANILGFHVGAPRAAAAPVTTAATEPPATDDAPPQTLAPAVVLQTEFVDQIVTISVPGATAAGPVAAPVAYTPAAAQTPAPTPAPAAGSVPAPAPVSAAPNAPVAAPVTTPAPIATTPSPATPAPTTPAPTAAPTTPAPTLPLTTTTLFNKAAYPFKIVIPSDWGSKPVPAPPKPAAGRQWKACELHDNGSWECEYP